MLQLVQKLVEGFAAGYRRIGKSNSMPIPINRRPESDRWNSRWAKVGPRVESLKLYRHLGGDSDRLTFHVCQASDQRRKSRQPLPSGPNPKGWEPIHSDIGT